MSKARTRPTAKKKRRRNQAEVAQLEHEILGQESNEGKASNEEISKVNKSSPSLKHYLVSSPKVITEGESKGSHVENVYTDSSLDSQAVSNGYPHFVRFPSPSQ